MIQGTAVGENRSATREKKYADVSLPLLSRETRRAALRCAAVRAMAHVSHRCGCVLAVQIDRAELVVTVNANKHVLALQVWMRIRTASTIPINSTNPILN